MKQLSSASVQIRNLQQFKDFYCTPLGFHLKAPSPESCVFDYQQGQASVAIRTSLEDLGEQSLGKGGPYGSR